MMTIEQSEKFQQKHNYYLLFILPHVINRKRKLEQKS